MFDTTDLQRIAVSLLGALVLSGACIAGAIAPARASAATAHVVQEASAPVTTGLVGAVRY